MISEARASGDYKHFGTTDFTDYTDFVTVHAATASK